MRSPILAVLIALSSISAHAAIRVWVADSLRRVRPQEPEEDTRRAVVKAARNEWVSFQIVVRGGPGGLRKVNARAGPIGLSRVTLYREHYVEVKTPSPFTKEGPGWYPDALLPFLDEYEPGARFVAAPFEVEEDRNQVLWVDLFLPAEAEPGSYAGAITITAADESAVEIGVDLTVRKFALPETPAMRSWFGTASYVAQWYGVSSSSPEYRNWNRRLAGVFAEHRISPLAPSYLYPPIQADGTVNPASSHQALKEFVETFRVTNFQISLQGSDPLGVDRARNVNYLRSMYAYLKQNGWEKMAYVYVLDEPNTAEAYETVRQRARFIHETQPGIKVLCTEQPTPQDPAWGTLAGSVDIWVPLWPWYEEEDGAARLKAGDEFWSYTALCQNYKKRITPFWQLDFPLLHYRVPAWINWRFSMTGLLYWTTIYWNKAVDMWTDPLTFRDRYNLEGLLVYPGGDAGFDGLLPSMRLKQIRDGFQDYDYLRLLADAGRREDADRIARSLARSWMDWEPDPSPYWAARDEIARRIESAP